MARTKKSNKKNDETPKIIRNYDPMSLEKRLYDLDHAPQRSWDLYSLEKRIYDLEINGGGGTMPLIEMIQNDVANVSDITAGTCDAKDYYPGFSADCAFLRTSGWIAYSGDTYWEFTFTDKCIPILLSWFATDSNRAQTPTGVSISEDGNTFEDITPVEMRFGSINTGLNKKVKKIRVKFLGEYTTSTLPMICGLSIVGVK